MPASHSHSPTEAEKAKEQAAADAEKERQDKAKEDAKAEQDERQRIADEAKTAAAEKKSGKKAVPTVKEPTPEDAAVAKFRKEYFGVEVEGEPVRAEWKQLNWVGGKQDDTCVITSAYGTLSDEDGTVLTFPRPVAEKLAAELRGARPTDRITVSTK